MKVPDPLPPSLIGCQRCGLGLRPCDLVACGGEVFVCPACVRFQQPPPGLLGYRVVCERATGAGTWRQFAHWCSTLDEAILDMLTAQQEDWDSVTLEGVMAVKHLKDC